MGVKGVRGLCDRGSKRGAQTNRRAPTVLVRGDTPLTVRTDVIDGTRVTNAHKSTELAR
jgi:hypothetical protein